MKKIITFFALTLIVANVQAQMKDVTVTIQPTVSYNWFDNNTAIEDGVMYGGRLGFGFGESIELRAIYERSTDLNNTINDFDVFSDDFVDNFNSRSVDIRRFGGEFKANIPTGGTFLPYLTLGAGVQELTVDIAALGDPSLELQSEQIYANVGLGTQIKLGNRLFLNLEGKNTIFNLNPSSVLYQEGQSQSDIEDLLNDNNKNRTYNWSVLAGLQLYLGGRTPEEYSALDKAYYDKFSGGIDGFKLIFEPAGAYIDFDKDSNLRDSYFLGGKVGFDLNHYVGFRAYYYQATQDEKISLDWDDLAIYGGDFVANLNVARGVVPYISVGGGYINAYHGSYVGKDGVSGASSGYFAKGGLGLNIPLGTNLEVFGDANLMYTSERATNDLENTIAPDELKQHTMFTVGLRFQLGKRADNTDEILQDRIDERVDNRTQAYQDRIDELESELADAYKNNDTKKAVAIIEEKKDLELKNGKDETTKSTSNKTKVDSKVVMTPQELERLIEKVIKGVDGEPNKERTIEDRMDRLELLLLEINTGPYRENLSPARQQDASQQILEKLNSLERNIERNTDKLNNMGSTQNHDQDKTVVISSGQQNPVGVPQNGQSPETKVVTDADGNTVVTTENDDTGVATGLVVNEGLSIFTGAAIADDVSMIIGIRGNYSFTNSPFKFMPDIYLAPGKNTGFGINANAVIPFEVNAGVILNPYIGAGIGYNDAVGVSTFSPNLIIGTSFNLLGGKLFADYTAHNFVDIHRLSVGYKLKF